jgi:hypothetical protein
VALVQKVLIGTTRSKADYDVFTGVTYERWRDGSETSKPIRT